MKSNMGMIDRAIRILIAIVIIGLYVTNILSGIVAIILLLLAGVFILVSFKGSCPLYSAFGISTKKKK